MKENDKVQENEIKDLQKVSYKSDYRSKRNAKASNSLKKGNSISNTSIERMIKKVGMHNFVSIYERQGFQNKKINEIYQNNLEQSLSIKKNYSLENENLITRIPPEINNFSDYASDIESFSTSSFCNENNIGTLIMD